jgi:hypothetical protein
MPEKASKDGAEKKQIDSTIDRRDYLKMASGAGATLGSGLGMSALGTRFTSPARAASTVVDDFGDTNLSDRYVFDSRGATTSVTSVSSAVTSGADTNVLQMEGDGNTRMHAYEGDSDTDLKAYPEIGETFSCWMRGLNGTENMNFMYGAQDKDNKYYVKLNLETGDVGLFKYVSGSGQSLAGDWGNSTVQNNTKWFKIEIEWKTNHSHTVTVYQNGSQVGSLSYTEDSGDPQFTATGVGYSAYLGSSETAQYDYATTSGESTPTHQVSNIDNFEVADKELSAYRFDRGESGAAIVADSETTGTQVNGRTYSGSRALKINDSSATELISLPGDGLEDYPNAGDTFKCYFKATGGTDNFNLTWGVQDHDNRYYVKMRPESDIMYLFKYKNADGTTLDSTSGLSISRDQWYYLEVYWGTDGTQTIELYDLEGNVLATVSGTDSEWTDGGVGFDAYLSSGEAVFFDCFEIIEQTGPNTGGWGDNHVPRYAAETASRPVGGDWSKINDFHWYLNYAGYEANSDHILHKFVASGLFNTYYKEKDFQIDPTQKELDPLELQEGVKMSGQLTSNQSNSSLTHYDEDHTWAFSADFTEWSNWKDDDAAYENEVSFNEFENEAVSRTDLTKNDPEWVKKGLYFAFDAFIALTAPEGVGLAISTVSFLTDLATHPEHEGRYIQDDPGSEDLETTGWSWDGEMALSVCMRDFVVRVDRNTGDTTFVLEHGVGPNNALDADNLCTWTINCPSTEKNAEWNASTSQSDINL